MDPLGVKTSEDAALAELRSVARRRDAATEALRGAVVRASDAGLSQRVIAGALGVSQPAVSQMLGTARARAQRFEGPMGVKLAEHRAEILDIARARGASKVRVFGSVVRGEDDEDSDLDLLVAMPDLRRLSELVELGFEISTALGVPVDVTAEQLVKPEALPALAASAVPL